jgi:hypothetical protein
VVIEYTDFSTHLSASLTLFTGTGFTGQSATLTNNGECGVGALHISYLFLNPNAQTINEPFISHLLSAKASAGDICFLYKDANGCSDCGACVDANGFRDMTAVWTQWLVVNQTDDVFIGSRCPPFPLRDCGLPGVL